MGHVNFVKTAPLGGHSMPRRKQPRIPFSKACEWAGGEDVLKNARDPGTGKPLFSRDWKDPRSRWYNYKSRGFPAYLLLPILVARLESEQPDVEGEAVEAAQQIVRIHRELGPRSPVWVAIRALLRAALEEDSNLK